MSLAEIWVPVVVAGFGELYEVSDLGQVRSRDRVVSTRNQWGPCVRRLTGQVISPRLNKRGELTVCLSGNGRRQDCRVHRLVLEAFEGPCPVGMEGLHGPAGKLDNSRLNLRWGTKVENQADRLRDGTSNHGERNTQARLTEDAVREIVGRYAAGDTQRELAKAFNVGRMTISDIVRHKSWRHLSHLEGAA